MTELELSYKKMNPLLSKKKHPSAKHRLHGVFNYRIRNRNLQPFVFNVKVFPLINLMPEGDTN